MGLRTKLAMTRATVATELVRRFRVAGPGLPLRPARRLSH
jgi:hypothetical protein